MLNVEIYIGDSLNWSENPKCANGPFLDPDDPNIWIASNVVGGNLWPNGIEAWCNMEGRYMTIVADYNKFKD